MAVLNTYQSMKEGKWQCPHLNLPLPIHLPYTKAAPNGYAES